MEKIIIDAEGTVLGRLASFVAKKALQGDEVVILNSEKAIITGKKKDILQDYLKKLRLGHGVQKGPLFSRKASLIFKRAIRGMIGRKKTKGREALRRVRCYEGIPEKYSKTEKMSSEKFQKQALNFITLEELSKLIQQK